MVSEKILQRNRANAEKRFIDLTAKIFGRLTVLNRVFTKSRSTMWLCRCCCGKEKIINGGHLKQGLIQSCGCLCLDVNRERLKGNLLSHKHGLSEHPLRYIRKSMIHRCYNKNNKYYKNYGGRGISVCDEWKNSLEKFVRWSIDNGWKKGLSLDRKDNDLNYCPENCQWITICENSRKNCVLGKLRKEKCDRNKVAI